MIAEHAVSRPPDGGSNASHFNKHHLEGSECLSPKVACQNADVVAYLPHKRCDPIHRAFVHVRMQVAELEYGKSIERTWKHRRLYVVVSQLNVLGIAQAAPVQARHHKEHANQKV